MKITSRHISFGKLSDLAENRLPGEERDEALSHLSACARCSGQFKHVEQIISLMRADSSTEDAPRAAISSAINLFRSRARASRPALVERIVAALSFDSQRMSPAFGVRSQQSGAARQLLYSAGECDLDLRVTQSGESWVVSGQVLGPCEGGEAVLKGEAGESQARLNEMCEFTLAPLPPGRYAFRLHLTNMEVEIPELELKA